MSLYVHIATELPKDPKIRRAGPMAELLYIRMILFCKEMMSDGKIDATQLDFCAVSIPGNHIELAECLVREGLWEKTENGWQIPFEKWQKWQTTSDEVEAIRAKRIAAGEKGARKRWGAKTQNKTTTETLEVPVNENSKCHSKTIAKDDFANGKKCPEPRAISQESVAKSQEPSTLEATAAAMANEFWFSIPGTARPLLPDVAEMFIAKLQWLKANGRDESEKIWACIRDPTRDKTEVRTINQMWKFWERCGIEEKQHGRPGRRSEHARDSGKSAGGGRYEGIKPRIVNLDS